MNDRNQLFNQLLLELENDLSTFGMAKAIANGFYLLSFLFDFDDEFNSKESALAYSKIASNEGKTPKGFESYEGILLDRLLTHSKALLTDSQFCDLSKVFTSYHKEQ